MLNRLLDRELSNKERALVVYTSQPSGAGVMAAALLLKSIRFESFGPQEGEI